MRAHVRRDVERLLIAERARLIERHVVPDERRGRAEPGEPRPAGVGIGPPPGSRWGGGLRPGDSWRSAGGCRRGPAGCRAWRGARRARAGWRPRGGRRGSGAGGPTRVRTRVPRRRATRPDEDGPSTRRYYQGLLTLATSFAKARDRATSFR